MDVERSSLLETFRERVRSSLPVHHTRAREDARDLLSWGATNFLYERDPQASAKRRISHHQCRLILAVLAVLVAAFILAPITTAITLNLAFILHSLAVTGFRIMALRLALQSPRPSLVSSQNRLQDEELPMITVICPLYQEAESIPNLIGALTALAYPREKLDIKLTLEEDDTETIAVAKRLATGPEYDIVLVPVTHPRTKPKACNYSLWSARGDLVVIYDAEDRPSPTQLREAAEAFAELPSKVACLQAHLNYYNRHENWLTRLFAAEYALIFDIILPGLSKAGAPLPLGGTSNIFRIEALIAVGAWDPYNVTEDADLGLRLGQAGYRTAMLDATTLEEATGRLGPWFRQRTRWIKGYMQSWAVHTRTPCRDWRRALTLHLVVGGVVLAALLNPLFWILYITWISGLVELGWLFPGIVGGLASASFLVGNLLLIWLYMIAPLSRRWHDLAPYALSAPLYWVLQSAAGYRAAWEFVLRPHHWDKTHHYGQVALEAIDPRDLEASG